jgi:hypothetical protein
MVKPDGADVPVCIRAVCAVCAMCGALFADQAVVVLALRLKPPEL